MIFSWVYCPSVLMTFLRCSDPSRNQPDHLIVVSVRVAHHKQSKFCAHSKEDVTVLFFGMLGVMDQNALLVKEDRGGFRKGDAVFALILTIFSRAPIKADIHIGPLF